MTTFSRWIPLPENEQAQLAVQRIAQDLGSANSEREINPLLLHGPSGTGKSHLAAALLSEVIQLRPDATALVLAAAELHRDLGNEQNGKRSLTFKDARKTDLLIIEDLQHLSAEGVTPLASLMDYRRARKQQVVLTAVESPAGLLNLATRLLSRLSQGLVVGLQPLSPASRRTYLKKRAQQRDVKISDGVLAWIAARTTGSARALEGALSRVESLIEINGGPLDVTSVAAAFAENGGLHQPTVDRIAHRVSRHYQLSSKQLQARDRSHHVLLPRQVSMYLARELTELSLRQIGDYFGGRDHSTVLHACRKVERALRKDVSLSGVVKQLQADLA